MLAAQDFWQAAQAETEIICETAGMAFPDCIWAGWSKHGDTGSTSAQSVTRRLEV